MVFNPQNPNAPPIYPCGICHKEVHDNDQAILCESGCNFWFHRSVGSLVEFNMKRWAVGLTIWNFIGQFWFLNVSLTGQWVSVRTQIFAFIRILYVNFHGFLEYLVWNLFPSFYVSFNKHYFYVSALFLSYFLCISFFNLFLINGFSLSLLMYLYHHLFSPLVFVYIYNFVVLLE